MFQEGQRSSEEFDIQLPPDYYGFLGISRNASPDKIRAAYKRMATKCHPDRFMQETEAVRKAAQRLFQILNEIHRTLMNPKTRGEYDESLGQKQAVQVLNREQKPDLTDFTKTERAGDFIVGYYPDGQKCVINPINNERTRAFSHNALVTIRQGILVVKEGKKEFYVETRRMMASDGFDLIIVTDDKVVGISYGLFKKVKKKETLGTL